MKNSKQICSSDAVLSRTGSATSICAVESVCTGQNDSNGIRRSDATVNCVDRNNIKCINTSAQEKVGKTSDAGNARTSRKPQNDIDKHVLRQAVSPKVTVLGVTDVKSKPNAKETDNSVTSLKSYRPKLYIEHCEKGTTHSSQTNVKNFHEQLTATERSILSEFVHAASLPDEIRLSLQEFLDRQDALAHIDADKKNMQKSSKTAIKRNFQWDFDTVPDSKTLKEIMTYIAKILPTYEKNLTELAMEYDVNWKENHFHATVNAFVELCIRTGMVCLTYCSFSQSTEKYC